VISSLLVANRGEIARRVFATCRRTGIGTVAVFSDPDAGSPHVAEADFAVRLPGASPAQTYLNGQAIVAGAIAAGADAVHPGYGFLAEDHRFARQVLAAGLTWIGPPPDAMQAMAVKIEARKRAAGAGVPVLAELDPAAITEFPVLVKASAGGGGRGMRAVYSQADLEPALASARREAQSAFGDGTVFCEPLLAGARHIEVQVLADQAGTVWALAERDCSVQRRYQKVIEESPSPAVGQDLRERLAIAAASLARAVGYQGAGTVEFLVTGQAEFYFLEFNTRLQVEHPVTECVHDIDLVALQLDVAQGLTLPDRPPPAVGHAIEARLYAEDPAAGYRPSGGPVHLFEVPGVDVRFGLPNRSGLPNLAGPPDLAGRPSPILRLDSGVETGVTVGPHYDAMLAKLISWAPSRDGAARRLAAGLAGTRICGPATNRDLLVSVLRNPVFTGGGADTSLLDGYDLAGVGPTEQADRLSALAGAVAIAAANRQRAQLARSIPGGWRNVVSQPQLTSFDGQRGRVDVRYHWSRTGITVAGVTAGGVTASESTAVESTAAEAVVIAFWPERVTLEVGGVQYRFDVTRVGDQIWVDSAFGSVRLSLVERLPAPVRSAAAGSLIAPMPGSVIRVQAAAGDRLAAGQAVLVLEAMKMEHQVTGPAGVLTELRVTRGSQVSAGDVLAIVTPDEPDLTKGEQ
jgi:propionyl-CoA carboxylase alpha chain